MSRTHRLEPQPPRRTLDNLEAAILLVEEHIGWMEVLRARLAAAGRGKDAAYAYSLLELRRGHLALLRWRREELLSRERPRQGGGGAFGAFLVRALRRRGRAGRIALSLLGTAQNRPSP